MYNRAPKEYNYNLSEYVKVGNYKGLEYKKPKVSVSDDEVKQEIEMVLAKNSKEEVIKSGKVEDGDTINVSYKGTIDGKAFEGGTTDSQDITIGETPMIDGFIEGLTGKNIGDKVTLNLKFPEDYHEEKIAGKDVTFVVKINSKKVRKTPKLNEDFVKNNSEFKTVSEYKKNVKKDILERKEKMVETQIKQELWTKIIDKSKAKKYPEKELKEARKKADEWESQYKSQATTYGMEWKDFLKNVMNTDEKGFKKIKEEYAENIVLNEMVMYSIAREEHVKLSKSEYRDKLDDIMEDSGYDEKTFKELFNMSIEKYAEQNNWEQSMLLDKVLDKIMEMGKEKKLTKDEQAEYDGMQQIMGQMQNQ